MNDKIHFVLVARMENGEQMKQPWSRHAGLQGLLENLNHSRYLA